MLWIVIPRATAATFPWFPFTSEIVSFVSNEVTRFSNIVYVSLLEILRKGD